jgi:hypothetical protein
MSEDHELDSWRERWGSVLGPSPDFQHKIQQKIKDQDRRFSLGNVLTAVALTGILIFAVVVRHQASWLGTGWATGICVLVFVSAGYRIWVLRGTWRAETQSTRAFVELWHRRVLARIRLLRIAIYMALGWIMYCAALTAANWTTIRSEVMAHPGDWLEVLVASVLMQPVIWFWASRLRRRKMAELNEVTKILGQMNETKD